MIYLSFLFSVIKYWRTEQPCLFFSTFHVFLSSFITFIRNKINKDFMETGRYANLPLPNTTPSYFRTTMKIFYLCDFCTRNILPTVKLLAIKATLPSQYLTRLVLGDQTSSALAKSEYLTQKHTTKGLESYSFHAAELKNPQKGFLT